jgi:hypothetical protein
MSIPRSWHCWHSPAIGTQGAKLGAGLGEADGDGLGEGEGEGEGDGDGEGDGEGVTSTSPVIPGLFVSWYPNVPSVGKLHEKLPPGWIWPESQVGLPEVSVSSAVDVCATVSSFTQVTVPPGIRTAGFGTSPSEPMLAAFAWMCTVTT